MIEQAQKPSFREEGNLIVLEDVGLRFNSKIVGSSNFSGLRNADYGFGFRMPTMPELVPLVYASLENQDYETAKNVRKTLRSRLTGNTAIHYFPERLFAEDAPELKEGRIVTPSQRVLEKRLGSHEERGVIFSDDRSVRFAPYGFKIDLQTTLQLAQNPGVIAFAGSEENAERLAKASEHYWANPYFWALSNVDSPKTRVADLNSGYRSRDPLVDRLDVYADSSVDDPKGYSFGVQNIKSGKNNKMANEKIRAAFRYKEDPDTLEHMHKDRYLRERFEEGSRFIEEDDIEEERPFRVQ